MGNSLKEKLHSRGTGGLTCKSGTFNIYSAITQLIWQCVLCLIPEFWRPVVHSGVCLQPTVQSRTCALWPQTNFHVSKLFDSRVAALRLLWFEDRRSVGAGPPKKLQKETELQMGSRAKHRIDVKYSYPLFWMIAGYPEDFIKERFGLWIISKY